MRVTRSSKFKKDYKLAKSQQKNILLLRNVIEKLVRLSSHSELYRKYPKATRHAIFHNSLIFPNDWCDASHTTAYIQTSYEPP